MIRYRSQSLSFLQLSNSSTIFQGNWWRLIQNAELPDVTPSQGRSRRPAQASSGSSRTRSQGIPTQSRRRRIDPWDVMTTTFAASETQDREALGGFQYEHMHASQNPLNQQHGEYAGGYSTSSASASTAHWQQSAGATTSLADSSTPGGQLPGIRSLGLLELGTRSGSRSYQVNSQLSQNNQQKSQAAHWGAYDENEDFNEEDD